MREPAAVSARNLRALLAGLSSAAVPDVEVTDLTLDSREVRPGSAFLALQGLRTHGIGFADQVVKAGAAAILCEPVANLAMPKLPGHVALVMVPGLGALAGAIADRFFGSPSRSMSIAGVTGTNGKTTTSYVIAQALQNMSRACAYFGTIGIGRIGALQAATHTTPDAVTAHRHIAAFRDQDVRFVALEVTSHALEQHRVRAVHFDTAVFTNLTHDHLDFHGSFAAYGAAKAKLFEWPELRHAVINVDDEFGRELLSRQRAAALTVCSSNGSTLARPPHASYVHAVDVVTAPHGLSIALESSWGVARVRSRFIGDFNVDNVLAAIATLLGWGITLPDAVQAIEQCSAPPGRMETVYVAGQPLVIVDYSHTPDALQKALAAARKHCQGRLICVFGCGGDRDAAKRPLMGGIAERLADAVIVTDDNPRTEDGDAIVADIVRGLHSPREVRIDRDRASAIEHAIRDAASADVILIAGKGHEDYQIVGTEKRYFSDREAAAAALRRRQ